MQTISSNSILEQVQDIVASDIEGETVMMSVEKGKYYGMDSIASRIWALIEEPKQFGELIDTLVQEFAVDPETCEKDILPFIEQLQSEGLIRISESA